MKRQADKRRVKLLVGIINKEDEKRFTEIVNDSCVALHFSGVGHGTARSSYMNYFGFNEIEKRFTMSLIPDGMEHSVLSAIGHGLKLYLVGRGIAFTVPLSGISSIVNDAILSGEEKYEVLTANRAPISKKKKESKTMHELVIAVVNTKYTDTAIEAARAAGATGATVFHTKSISNERAEQTMGTAVSRETDSIFFLTTLEFKNKIMEAVRDAAGLKTEGGAIIFSLPVDDLVGIGRFEDYVDGEEESK
jgi:nitrogen regulatory protein PII